MGLGQLKYCLNGLVFSKILTQDRKEDWEIILTNETLVEKKEKENGKKEKSINHTWKYIKNILNKLIMGTSTK